jgi:hypothetical protein
VVLGCIMMRVCHLNTCPVGVATQDPNLRKRFTGNPEHVVNFMRSSPGSCARSWPNSASARSTTWSAARTSLIRGRPIDHWKAKGLISRKILHQPDVGPEVGRYLPDGSGSWPRQVAGPDEVARHLPAGHRARREGEGELAIINVNRVVGTITGSEVTKRHGANGLPEDTVQSNSTAAPGRASARFVRTGMTLELEGDANDYFGKGLSGGKLIIYPPKTSTFKAEENMIVGNVAFTVRRRRGLTSAAWRANGSRAQFRRERGGGGRRRSRLRIHDRRQSWSCSGSDRAQLRGGHVRRHRLHSR